MYIKVKVTSEAKHDTLIKRGATIEVGVKEKAIRNLANNRAKEMVAKHFGVTERQIRIVSGHRSPSKIFSIETDK